MKSLLLTLILCCNSLCPAQSPLQLLDSAARNNSPAILDAFFQQWHDEMPAYSQEQLSRFNDTIQQAYKVFEAFSSRTSRDGTCRPMFSEHYYDSLHFLVVQNKSSIYFRDKVVYSEQDTDEAFVRWVNLHVTTDSLIPRILQRKNGKLSQEVIQRLSNIVDLFEDQPEYLSAFINDFRPQLNIPNKKVVFLSAKRELVLDQFFDSNFTALDTGCVLGFRHDWYVNPKLWRLLMRRFPIFIWDWDGFWNIETHTFVTSIVFDRNMKYARVYHEDNEVALLERVESLSVT